MNAFLIVMRRALVALVSIFVVSGCSKPTTVPRLSTMHVLFVGNSLTFANDLPKMVADCARARNVIIAHDMYAPGGYTLSQHAVDGRLAAKIANGGWDYVVLQEQSILPALPQERVASEVYPFAKLLADAVKASNPVAQVVFYMTMGKKDGEQEFAKTYPMLSNYDWMQERLAESYTVMAEQNSGLLAPVGRVWQRVRKERPTLELYADNTHPNVTGTYLAALVFFSLLCKGNPIGLPHPQGIDDATAAYLQKTVSIVLADQNAAART